MSYDEIGSLSRKLRKLSPRLSELSSLALSLSTKVGLEAPWAEAGRVHGFVSAFGALEALRHALSEAEHLATSAVGELEACGLMSEGLDGTPVRFDLASVGVSPSAPDYEFQGF